MTVMGWKNSSFFSLFAQFYLHLEKIYAHQVCQIKLIADDQGCLFCSSHILFIYRFLLSNVKAVKQLLASSRIQVFTIHTHWINISEYNSNFEQKAQGNHRYSGRSSTSSDFAATIISTIDVIVRSELSKKLQTSCPQLHNMLLDQVHI